jgi:hypothetical protein
MTVLFTVIFLSPILVYCVICAVVAWQNVRRIKCLRCGGRTSVMEVYYRVRGEPNPPYRALCRACWQQLLDAAFAEEKRSCGD